MPRSTRSAEVYNITNMNRGLDLLESLKGLGYPIKYRKFQHLSYRGIASSLEFLQVLNSGEGFHFLTWYTYYLLHNNLDISKAEREGIVRKLVFSEGDWTICPRLRKHWDAFLKGDIVMSYVYYFKGIKNKDDFCRWSNTGKKDICFYDTGHHYILFKTVMS